MSLGVSAGTKSSTRATSRTFVPSGAASTNSTRTPTRDFLRKGTRTRLPGCATPRIGSGTAYVNVVRKGTGSATLQKEQFILRGVVYQEGKERSKTKRGFSVSTESRQGII